MYSYMSFIKNAAELSPYMLLLSENIYCSKNIFPYFSNLTYRENLMYIYEIRIYQLQAKFCRARSTCYTSISHFIKYFLNYSTSFSTLSSSRIVFQSHDCYFYKCPVDVYHVGLCPVDLQVCTLVHRWFSTKISNVM
jgi:hypothetical protein